MDIIIYHNADPDGIFSGAIALKANPNALTIGYNYEPEFDNIITACKDKQVVILDVSPKNWGDMHRLCEVAKGVTWIDHHATAINQCLNAKTIEKFKNFHSIYEGEKWGAAKKTWEYFYPEYPCPPIIKMVAAYDAYRDYGSETWESMYVPFRFSVNHLRHPQDVLMEFEIIKIYNKEAIYFDDPKDFIQRGRAIARYVQSENKILVNNPSICFETYFQYAPGRYHKVLAINRSLFGDMFKSRTDIENYDFVVGFYAQFGEWKVSLRGTGKNIDLGQIAKVFGGGGHANAAGFSVLTFNDLKEILIYLT